ncbi:trans-sialidase [Trypanosoma cruzi]|nr:trans-sialidase [Trypanosoma cruzi]
MGTSWTEAIGTLSAVWVNARSEVSQKESLRVDALITATIEEGRKVMLCTQRGHASGNKRHTALCLWVTDSNRTFSVGPVAVDNASNWKREVKDCGMHLDASRPSCYRRACAVRMALSCGATWMALLLRVPSCMRCAAGFFSP